MKSLALAATCIVLGASTLVAAQIKDGEPERATPKPGFSRDGSGPSSGALIGGSARRPASMTTAEEEVKRCKELGGALQHQCLVKAQAADTGRSARDAAKRR